MFSFIFSLFIIAACTSWHLKEFLPDSLKRFAWWPLKILVITYALILLGWWLFVIWIFVVGINGLGWIFSVPFIATWIFVAYRMIVDFLVDDFFQR